MIRQYLLDYLAIRHMPRAHLARKLGVNRRTVVRWCGGETPCPADLVEQLDALQLAAEPRAPAILIKTFDPAHGRYMRKMIRAAYRRL